MDGQKALEALCENIKIHSKSWGFKKNDLISMLDFISSLTDSDVMNWYNQEFDISLNQKPIKSKTHLSLVK